MNMTNGLSLDFVVTHSGEILHCGEKHKQECGVDDVDMDKQADIHSIWKRRTNELQ